MISIPKDHTQQLIMAPVVQWIPFHPQNQHHRLSAGQADLGNDAVGPIELFDREISQ